MTPKQYNKKFGTLFKTKKNKYNAKKAELNGVIYDSTGEMEFAWELEQQKKAGIILGFDRQVKESFYINGVFICNYYVDFLVYLDNNKKKYIEYKGKSTELWRLKWKMLKAKYKDDKNVECVIEWHKPKYKYKFKK